MRTYLLRDVGYDGIQRENQLWEITDSSLIEAIRQIEGFETAAHIERRAAGAMLMDVYEPAIHSGADWNKIGCIMDETGIA